MATRGAPPSFDLFPDDLIAGTVDLDAREFGCYLLALCFQWGHGFVPSEPRKLARIMRVSEEELRLIWPVLQQKFTEIEPGRWVNPRMQSDREKQVAKYKARVEAGRKGGSSKATNLLQAKRKQKRSKGKGEEGRGKGTVKSKRNGYSDDFELFWSACPRKTGKGKASEAFDAALANGGDADAIIQAMRDFAYAQWPDGRPRDEIKYIPHPATWLNQRRYDDEPEIWEPKYNDDPRGNKAALQKYLGSLNGD